MASRVPEGTRAQRGASAGQFGSRLRVPSAGKRDGGRERRKEGRREECPRGRGLVRALGAGDRDGGGRARDAETRRRTARSPSTGGSGRRAREARSPAGPGLGTGPRDEGGSRREGLPVRSLPHRPAAVRPAPGWGWEVWEVPGFPAPACGAARFARRAGSWGRPGATPLFPTFFRSFWGLGSEGAALEPAGRWGSGGEIAGRRDHTSREGPPSSERSGDCYHLRMIGGGQDSDVRLA